jgi:hypothetical protein
MNIKDLSTDQILKVIAIKKKIEKLHTAVEKRVEKLQARIDSIAGAGTPGSSIRKKRRMSRAGRAAIAAGARARWAKYRGNGAAKKSDRRSSPAVRAKLAAAARARWKKAKREGKTTL